MFEEFFYWSGVCAWVIVIVCAAGFGIMTILAKAHAD